jgi:hypothetical protein
MTRQELDEKLIARGAKRSSLTNKVIPIMLEIFAEDESSSEALKCLQDMRDHEVNKWSSKEIELRNKESRLIDRSQEIYRRNLEINEREQLLKEREDVLLNLETAEARDRMKLAMIYERMSRPDKLNEFQLTQYIAGLGLILGNKPQTGAEIVKGSI